MAWQQIVTNPIIVAKTVRCGKTDKMLYRIHPQGFALKRYFAVDPNYDGKHQPRLYNLLLSTA